jgi:hypothetical protein
MTRNLVNKSVLTTLLAHLFGLFEMSFRSLLPLLASKFSALQKNTSAIAKCSCLWSFCSFQPLPSSCRQYEVLIDLQSVFDTAFPNVKIKPIKRGVFVDNKKQIKVWQATVIQVHQGRQT